MTTATWWRKWLRRVYVATCYVMLLNIPSCTEEWSCWQKRKKLWNSGGRAKSKAWKKESLEVKKGGCCMLGLLEIINKTRERREVSVRDTWDKIFISGKKSTHFWKRLKMSTMTRQEIWTRCTSCGGLRCLAFRDLHKKNVLKIERGGSVFKFLTWPERQYI